MTDRNDGLLKFYRGANLSKEIKKEDLIETAELQDAAIENFLKGLIDAEQLTILLQEIEASIFGSQPKVEKEDY